MALCDASTGYGGSWGDDGNIIAALRGVLWRIPSGGGTVHSVTELKPERKDLAHWWPQVLPGAQAVLFTAVSTDIEPKIEALSLRTGESKTVVREAYYGRYVPSGHLLFMRAGTLYAAPMDARRLALTGPPAAMIEDTAVSANSLYAQVDFSRSGTLMYLRGNAQKLVWLDSNGPPQPLRTTAGLFNQAVRFSPDGKRSIKRDWKRQRGRLGVRLAAGCHDSSDLRFLRVVADMEPGRQAHRFHVGRNVELVLHACGWCRCARSTNREQEPPSAVLVLAGWQAAGVFRV